MIRHYLTQRLWACKVRKRVTVTPIILVGEGYTEKKTKVGGRSSETSASVAAPARSESASPHASSGGAAAALVESAPAGLPPSRTSGKGKGGDGSGSVKSVRLSPPSAPSSAVPSETSPHVPAPSSTVATAVDTTITSVTASILSSPAVLDAVSPPLAASTDTTAMVAPAAVGSDLGSVATLMLSSPTAAPGVASPSLPANTDTTAMVASIKLRPIEEIVSAAAALIDPEVFQAALARRALALRNHYKWAVPPVFMQIGLLHPLPCGFSLFHLPRAATTMAASAITASAAAAAAVSAADAGDTSESESQDPSIRPPKSSNGSGGAASAAAAPHTAGGGVEHDSDEERGGEDPTDAPEFPTVYLYRLDVAGLASLQHGF
jgi:hypothetical protein